MFLSAIISITTPLEFGKVIWQSVYTAKKMVFQLSYIVDAKLCGFIDLQLNVYWIFINKYLVMLYSYYEAMFYGIKTLCVFVYGWSHATRSVEFLNKVFASDQLINGCYHNAETLIKVSTAMLGFEYAGYTIVSYGDLVYQNGWYIVFAALMLVLILRVWDLIETSIEKRGKAYYLKMFLYIVYFIGFSIMFQNYLWEYSSNNVINANNYLFISIEKGKSVFTIYQNSVFILLGVSFLLLVEVYKNIIAKKKLNSSIFGSYLLEPSIFISLLLFDRDYKKQVEEQIGFALPTTNYGLRALFEVSFLYILVLTFFIFHDFPIFNTVISTINIFWGFPILLVLVVMVPLFKILGIKYINVLETGKAYKVGFLIHFFDLISHCLRLFSLGFRTSANLTTGLFLDTLIYGVFLEVLSNPEMGVKGLPVVALSACYVVYHAAGVAAQLYVFVLMSSVYIKDSGF